MSRGRPFAILEWNRSPENRARTVAQLRKLNADPEFQARRIAALREAYRRRMRIPDELIEDYRVIVGNRFSAREARRMLGLA